MTAPTKRDAVNAAMTVAEDIAEGRLDPAALEDQAVTACRERVGRVIGPGDAFWTLHGDIARQAVALGALTADELSEWAAVLRRRAGEPPMHQPAAPVAPVVGTIAPVHDAGDDEGDPLADVPEDVLERAEEAAVAIIDAHRRDRAEVSHDETPAVATPAVALAPPAQTSPRPDHYDPMAAWAAGATRRY